VGSIEYIHRRLVDARDAGAAISSSHRARRGSRGRDRIGSCFDGRIVGVLAGDDATYEKIGLLMGGASFGGGVAA